MNKDKKNIQQINIELDENTIEAAFMTAHSIHICYQA